MQQQSVVRTRSSRFAIFFRAQWLLFAILLWPTLASAQVSPYCPTQSMTVANGGSVTSINLAACDGPFNFGMGGPFAPFLPANGSVVLSSQSGPGNQTVTYTHNGTATTTDTFALEDENGDELTFNVTITPPTSAIIVSPASLPTLTAGTSFSQTLTSTGGAAPYTYTLSGGTLPTGLTLSAAGVLSGTPTQRGGYAFGVRSQDNVGAFVIKGYTGTVQNPSLSLATPSATAVQGAPFSLSLAVNGGVAPHSFQHEVVAGPLPPGISLSAAGVLSGTPTTLGTTNFQMRVTDASTGLGSYFELENYSFTVVAPPSVSIAVAPASVSEDGATNLVYTVTRSLNLSSPTVVNITTGGTATSGTDYTGGVATVSIPAGATTATITINPTADAGFEADETVILTVAAGSGYTVGAPASATGTILNDDVLSASITVAPASVSEDGAANLVYTVTLSQAPLVAIAVNFTVTGTATSGTDYAAVTSPVTIAAGATTGTVTVNPAADATIETNETVILTLNAGTGYTVGAPASATGTILNDDLPTLTINDVTVNEGNAGTTNFTFTVSLSAPAGPGGVTFDIATANGTASAGVDYVANSLTGQTIPAGNSTYSFTVLVNGDTLSEPNKTFFVNVTNVTNAVVGDAQGVGTITNDDPAPSLSINDVTVTEGNAGTVNAVFTVTLSAASGQTVTVNYATADGTATQPADYTNTSGTLTFTPGATTQTITVPVIGETVPEANETFFVNLSGAVNATIADNQGVGTITNDDVPVTVNPATIPNATVATAYSQTLTASGGTAPYGFAVTAGALPAGLTLSSGGILSGTSTAGGTFNFTVTATDSSGLPGPFSGSRAYTLVVNPATVVLPATPLAGGTLGAAYSAAITPASGGTAPYTYAVTAGALPGGLTLNAATGAITGTPSALGTFNFAITATDSSTGSGPYSSAPRGYSIVVLDNPPVTNSGTLTVAYNAAATPVPLNITGGTPTSVAIASTPTTGTAIATGTTITYQPAAGFAGSDSFTYTASNSGGTSVPATVTVTVSEPVITITAGGSLAATVAVAYTQTFTWSGGAQPWSSYQVTNLPAGVSITGTTANTVTISGTPTQAGSFNLNVSATDSSTGNGPYSVGEAFTLTVAGPTLALAPAGTTFTAPYNVAYSQSFTASGGVGPYTYARTGTLPPDLSFAGNTVSGTPATPGSYSFTITATDTGATGTGAPFTVAQNYTITVAAPTIAVNPATLPNPTAGAAYSQTLTATGGAAPYTFALTAGALPNGIALASGGALSGTSTVVGTYTFTATATDGNGQTGSRAYTVTIAAPTLTMTPAAGTLTAPYGAAYTQTFTASGGSNTFSHTLSGALPAGLSFSGNTITGTPTVPGNYPITVTATDTVLTGTGAPFSIAQNYTLNVPAPAVAVNPATLPNPTAGAAYSQTLTATGGSAPYTFALTAGALPNGIALASGGALSGTSTVVGTYTFTATATDGNGQTGSRAYTVTIAAPTLTMTPAAGTLTAPYGAAYTQTFTASGGSNTFSHTLSGALPAGLSFSGNTITGTPTVPGNYPITVTATDTVLTGTGAPFSIAQNYTLNVPAPAVAVNPATLPNPTAGAAYSQTLTATGGAAPYTFALTAGALPNGIALASGGALSGTSTVVGTYTFTATATDGNGQTGSRAYTVTIAAPTLTMTPAAGTLTAPYGAAYTQTFTASGGSNTFSHTLSGALPAGLSFSGNTITGTPTVPGNYPITVTATDTVLTGTGAPFSIAQNYTLNVPAPAVAVNPATLPNPTAGAAYSQTLTATGGAAPYTFALTAGALPNGIALASGGALSGTSTVVGTYTFTATATDGNGQTGSRAYTVTIAAPTLTMTPAAGTLTAPYGAAYTQTFTASGGSNTFSHTLSGALPAGLSFSGNTITGTPTVPGNYPITVTATDTVLTGTGAPFSIAQNYTLNVPAPAVAVNPATLPNPTAGAAYSQTLTATGGSAPYTFALTAGALPNGIALASGGALSGTSTVVGTYTFTATATDGNGQTGSRAYTVTIAAPTLTMTPAAGTLTAPYGAAYTQTFTASGGSNTFSHTLSGALPAGLSFSGNTITGTPTVPGNYPITVTATDTVLTGTGAPFSIAQNYTLNVPAPAVAVNPATLPNPTAGAAYSQTLTATGGAAPYTFALTAGALPNGIALASGGALSGTSTVVGTYTFTATATDGNGQTGSRAYTVTIAAPTLTMTPAAGTLTAPYGAAYTQTFTASGGSNTFSHTLSGALPAGLSFSGNTITGTPTVPGNYPITVTATDTVLTGTGAPFSIAQNYTLNVPAPAVAVNPATLPNPTAGAAYSQTLTATGGAAPYTFALTAGALPNGIALASGGALSGTSTASGTFAFTIAATDANGQMGDRAYTLVVAVPTLAVTPVTLPAGTAGTAYSQTLTISGGIAPYTAALSGVLPAGLTFNAATRSFSGTPTQSGTFNISVTVTDSTGGTAATITTPYTLSIAAPSLTLTPATVPSGTGGVAYAQMFSASGGIAPYSYTVSAGALPQGLTLNASTGALAGTPSVAGSFNFSITGKDSTTGAAGSVTQAYTLPVSAPAITLTPETLPAGLFAVSYPLQLTAVGGTAPYRYAVTSGALPAGLTLSNQGLFTGAPNAAGTFTVTITVTDALNFTGLRVYTLTVAPRPDPALDPEVRGLLNAQSEAAHRFATSQIGNFQQRMQRLHGRGAGTGFSNMLSASARSPCNREIGSLFGNHCDANRQQPFDGDATSQSNAATADRVAADASASPLGIWTAGTLRSGGFDNRVGTVDLDFETDGVSFGADYRVSDHVVVGLGAGYGRDRTHVGNNGSRSDATAYSLAAYTSISPTDRFFIDALFGYQTLDFDLRRHVTADGSQVMGSRKGSQWFGSVSTGADLALKAWQFTPYLRVDAAHGELDGYREQSNSPYALQYGAMDVESLTGNVGVRFDYRQRTTWGSFSPQLNTEYQHDFSGNGLATMQYNDLLRLPFYRSELDGYSRSRWLLGAGMQFNWDSGWGLRVDYRTLVGGSSTDHGLQLYLDAKF